MEIFKEYSDYINQIIKNPISRYHQNTKNLDQKYVIKTKMKVINLTSKYTDYWRLARSH